VFVFKLSQYFGSKAGLVLDTRLELFTSRDLAPHSPGQDDQSHALFRVVT